MNPRKLFLTLFMGTALAAQATEAPYLSTSQLFHAGSPENEALRRTLTDPPQSPQILKGKRIAVLTTDGVERIELLGTLHYFRERGATAEVVAPRLPQPDPKYGVHYPARRATHILTVAFLRNVEWVKIDRFIDEVSPADFDALIVPGGAWNPDSLRIDAAALELVKAFYRSGKVIAAICHGPLVFLNAGILKGRHATATWNVQLDLANAGATVQDVPVVVDGTLVTSRHPLDFPQFAGAIERLLTSR